MEGASRACYPPAPMGFLNALFGGTDAPTEKQVLAAVKALETRHGEPARRYEAADRLAAWGTPDALLGLLRRYTFNAEKEMSDEEEKAYVADLLEKAGRKAVGPIEKHVQSEAEVAWALRILERVLPQEEFRERACAILSRLDVHFDRIPERKVDILHALAPHASDARVADATLRFLEDTDDSVRIAAVELLLASGRDADRDGLLECLVRSGDRPRVLAAVLDGFAAKAWPLGDRIDEVRGVLSADQGFALTKDGLVVKLRK